MYEFDSRLSCGNLENVSKTGELFCKRIQTYSGYIMDDF